MKPLAADDPAEIAGYRLRSRLGTGGMGVVYLAYTPGGHPVALKVVRPELGDDAEFRTRFRQEAEAARRVTGLYTAQLLDADPDGSPPWLVTAYVSGPSLAEAVAAHGPMPEHTVLVLMAGVAEALAAIHAAGIVHRDLKPSNVLLAADGPKVIDFGIARALEATALTRTGMSVGSPQFISPDQLRGGIVTGAADVFALGGTACYAAVGRPPFGDGDTASLLYRVMHDEPDLTGCPPQIRPVIAGCLAKDPAARPAPARVIHACRTQAGPAVTFGDSWLPPAISADLTRHAPSAAAAAPTARPAPAAGLAAAAAAADRGPAPAAPADPAPRPAAPGRVPTEIAAASSPELPPAAATPPTFRQPQPPSGGRQQPAWTYGQQPAPYPGQQPPARYGGQPPAWQYGQQPPGQPGQQPPGNYGAPGWQQGAAPRPEPAAPQWTAPARQALGGGRRRLWAILSGVGVVVVALVGYLVASSGNPASGHPAAHTQTAAGPAGAQKSAGPSASPASSLASCVVGSWAGGADVNPLTIKKTNTTLTGPHGPDYTFRSDGTGTAVMTASKKLTGTYQGQPITLVAVGTQQFRWQTANGEMTVSMGKATGTETLYDSAGNSLGSGPFGMTPTPSRVSCTATKMVSTDIGDDGSEVLTRSG